MSETQSPELLKKLTMDTMFGKKPKEHWTRELKEGENRAFYVGRIAGRVIGTRAAQTNFGPYVRFQGQFRGISGLDGKVYTAPVCLLPQFLQEEIDAAFVATGEPIDFAYDIFTREKPAASLGFEYVAKPLLNNVSSIETMLAQLPEIDSKLFATIPALPAPENTENSGKKEDGKKSTK